MAPAIAHFLVGASILLLVATPVALRYDLGDRWPLWLVLLGGVWGLVPDLHHVAPGFEAPLVALHDSGWADLFALHHALDRPAVRARYDASVFGAIVLFIGSVGAFTLAGGARDRRDEGGTVHAAIASPTLAIVAGAGALCAAVVFGTILRVALG